MRKQTFTPLTAELKRTWDTKQKRQWEKNSNFWIQIIRKNLDPFRSKVTDKAILKRISKQRQRILDVGCGEGYLARKFAKEKSAKVTGIDTSPTLILAAQKAEEKKALGITYQVADIRNTGFPKSSFDYIVAQHSIQAVYNPKKAFEEFYRILKKDGRFIILFPHPCFDIIGKGYLSAEQYFTAGQLQKDSYLVGSIKSPSPYSDFHLPLEEWINIISAAGFSIGTIKEPHPPLSLLQKKWWKQGFNRPRFILIEGIKM